MRSAKSEKGTAMRLTRRRILTGLAASAAAGGAFAFGNRERVPALASSNPDRLPIGMNLAGVNDYEPSYPFINAMWGARPWLTRNANGTGPWTTNLNEIEIDENGYPLSVPFAASTGAPQIVFTLLPNTLKEGRYVLTYEGEGAFKAGGQTKILRAESGRIELLMGRQGKEQLEEISILRSSRGNHVRNIRVVPVANEKSDLDAQPFLPEFLQFCQGWHSLRFMDFLGTNNSIERAWSRRKRTSFYTQVGTSGDVQGIFGSPLQSTTLPWASGVALELCIDLANKTGTPPWLCVPHLADDDYIRQMAELVKTRLDPALKIYIEYSNELWNWQFLQAQWMLRSEIAAEGVVRLGGRPPWKGGKVPAHFRDGIVAQGEGIDHPERIAALFVRCFKVWDDVFGSTARARLVRVCAAQAHWPETGDRMLGMIMRNSGCDAFAVGGYFGPDDAIYKRWEAAGAALKAEDVIADMRKAVAQEAINLRRNADVAKKHGVRLVVYEGGQHIQPRGQKDVPYAPALGQAQSHPAMYDLYAEHLRNSARQGVDLFCAFNSASRQGTRYGSWGHVEFYGQPASQAPKYRALLDCNVPAAKP